MTAGDAEGVRSVRLPISGDVVQWLPDGRWRMVSRDQFETEQSRSARLPVTWASPADLTDGVSGEGRLADAGGSPGWYRWWGAVGDDPVEARYADGCDAPVIMAGPLWVVESLDSVGRAYVAVGGEPWSRAMARQRVSERMFDPHPQRTGPDDGPRAWWGSPSTSSQVDRVRDSPGKAADVADDDVDLRVRQGVAFVVWNDNSHQRATGRGSPERDYYSCSLQPFGGQRLPREDGPEVPTLDEAMEWARARTSTILVRPEWDPGQHYWATDEPPKRWKRLR